MRRIHPVVAPPQQELLYLSEAARALGLTVWTIRRRVQDRKLPAIRTLGGHRRVPRAAVHAEAVYMGLRWALDELKEEVSRDR